ncbi:MAG: KUP/HAK/KT family potassium transporter [Spirochaetia bacterium]|nr:KUP/HAK/KT family potassium transporter [Spirochaetia bacterium]
MEREGEGLKTPTLLEDIRIIFATILTDPGSSLAYGADALIHVTVGLIVVNYTLGAFATAAGAGIILVVYLLAIIVYNSMTRHHTHKVLGGGAFVSAYITSQSIKKHPRLKKFVSFLGKMGTGSLLADFPATQAISLVAGVEALYFIPLADRLKWVLGFLFLMSFIQRYGLGNLARYLIWPVLGFYSINICINAYGLTQIFANGWHAPVIPATIHAAHAENWLPLVLHAVANGATLITGVEVGYSSVNIPHHKDKAIRVSMWVLYSIVLVTYSMQIINFLGLGVTYDRWIPVPLQIAKFLGGDALATGFGVLTAVMLLLAAQTAQTDFPLEVLRASRSNFFPRGIGDMAWKRTTRLGLLGGHDGVYNPRATALLATMTLVIVYFFPSSHAIESMYGLAVLMAMNIDIFSYLLRQIRTRKIAFITVLGLIIMNLMLLNILYNKFWDGAWFILVLLILYLVVFLISEAIYAIWLEKLNVVPLELGLWYPAFQNRILDEKNIVLVSKFHPGVIHFLKNYVKSGHIPLVVHFRTDSDEEVPRQIPDWYRNIDVPESTDTITAITRFVRQSKATRVHLIPSMVRGIDPISRYYFGNSIERLKYAVSQYADLQVEYNKERIEIQVMDIARRIFPAIARKFKKRPVVAQAE